MAVISGAAQAGIRHPANEADFFARPGNEPVQRYPVIVVGAGPVGLALAIDLARQGVTTLLLDRDHAVSTGSRAICFAKRSLEILDRLGVAERAVAKGVQWQIGKVFFHDRQIYQFDLLPEPDHKQPGFINLQQYYLEEYLIDHLQTLACAELRWQNEVIDVTQHADYVTLTAKTPQGEVELECDYLIAADGSRSRVRAMLGLDFSGQTFQDRFLIADVIMKADFPPERWFWFEPPFFNGRSTLLHRQPDNVWRIDFQLGWRDDFDPEQEKKPENVIPKLKAMLGEERQFELDWVSVYTFSCMRMEQFCHGRVIFAGDAAHVVSPFGARGCNGGLQDADNLAWKLNLVLADLAPASLLDSYDVERGYACDENIKNSTRSTDFMTPKNAVSRAFRDAVLELAGEKLPFAQKLVNSGRLSLPAVLTASPLNTPDAPDPGLAFSGPMLPGAPCADAPVESAPADGPSWLLDYIGRDGGSFYGLYFVDPADDRDLAAEFAQLEAAPIPIRTLFVTLRADSAVGIDGLVDSKGRVNERYDGKPGSYYLIRPDQHVAARWRRFDLDQVRRALRRATAQPENTP